MTQAQDFATSQVEIWDGGAVGAENAVQGAIAQCATRTGPASHDGYRATPGDIPASRWTFPDGSELVIFDDGTGLAATEPAEGGSTG